MSFSTKKYDSYTLISLSTDKLDAVVSPDLKAELVLINKSGEKNIVLDLSSVKYCDSSGLSALLIGNRMCKEVNGSFIISSLQPAVQKLVTISQLDGILNITPTLPEAIDLLFMEEIGGDDIDDDFFSVLILGSSSASPTLKRNPTSQLLNVNEQYYLVDCGEGTQTRLRENKIKFQRINHIFISHLHGDHYLGLIGLLQTMHLLGRTTPINIYAPEPLKEIIDLHLKYSGGFLRYPLHFNAISSKSSEIILENEQVKVSTVILDHRIPCTGFVFKEQPKLRKIKPQAIAYYRIPKYAINQLKKGEDFTHPDTGEIIKNELVTSKPAKSYSYAFCSDTKYSESIIPQIKDVDLLYHEATFMENESKRAVETYHSTAKQAATIALKANVNSLIIGHFSNRYLNLDGLLEEAKSIFENTQLAFENKWFEIAQSQ